MEAAGHALFLLYEFFIFVTCLNIFYRIGRAEGIAASKILLLVISAGIAVSALLSTIFSFLMVHSMAHYLLAGAALAGISSMVLLRDDFARYRGFVSMLIHSLYEGLVSRRTLLILLLILPIILNIVKVPGDIDSVHVMDSLIPIAENRLTPYTFYYNYVAFWELSYVPSLVITDSDSMLWLNSAKPVILIGLAGYVLGRRLGIPRLLASVLAVSGMLFFHFWIPEGPSGISTLKNDMIFGAGVMLLAYYFVHGRARPGFSSFVIFLLGSVFVLNKYSGVPVLLLAIILVLWMHRKSLSGVLRPYVWLYVAGITATAGHYYLKNLIVFQNPFYPIQVMVAGVGFENGLYDLSGTSILSSLAHPVFWEYVIPADPLRLALLAPLYAGLLGVPILLAYGALRRQGRPLESRHYYALILIMGAWLLYFNSGWSASAYNQDMGYLRDLNSLRYVEGLAVLTDVFLVFLLWRTDVPRMALGALLAVHLSVRLILLYSHTFYSRMIFHANFEMLMLAFPYVFVLALLGLGRRITRTNARLAVLAFGVSAVFVFSPYLLESNRMHWVSVYNDIIFETYDSEGSEIALIARPTNSFSHAAYLFSGENFRHDVAVVTETEFYDRNGELYFERAGSYMRPDHIVTVCDPPEDCSKYLQGLADAMSDYGYFIRLLTDRGIVMQAGS